MSTLAMLGAIGFDPTIRGILVVITGTVCLGGALYMILATNSGARVGFMISAAGMFGWCFLMGIAWTIYGIGLVGRAPAWMPTDINYSRSTPISEVPEMAELPPETELANAEALLEEYPLLWSLALGAEGEDWEPTTLTRLKTVVEPWVVASTTQTDSLTDGALDTGSGPLGGDAELRSLLETGGPALRDEVRLQAEELRDEIQVPLGDWCLLTESDPRRGEAVASSDAALAAKAAFGEPTTTASYIVKDVFVYGGKEPCNPVAEIGMPERTLDRVVSVVKLKHPKMLSAVTVGKAKQFVVPAGEAPPAAQLEEGASTVSVVMLRNLGNKRLIPFAFTMVSFAGFVIFTTLLHYRDKRAMDVRAAFEGNGK